MQIFTIFLNAKQRHIQCLSVVLFLFLITEETNAQAPTHSGLENIANESFAAMDKKYSSLNDRMNKYLEKELKEEQKFESRLAKKIARKDSLAATQIVKDMASRYGKLSSAIKNPLENKRVSKYIPLLDSLQTAGKFLEQSKALNTDKLNEVQQLNGKLKELEGNLNASEQVENFLKERKALLTAQLERFGMTKELGQLKQRVYYYRQQMDEYKNVFNDEKTLEAKALEAVRTLPAFQNFMQKNSYLAELFPSSNGSTAADPSAPIAGLQTRASVQSVLQERLGAATMPSPNVAAGAAANPLDQSMQAAQQQLSTLKDKINKLGGNNSDMEIPDFKPNAQKTKTFFQRLEPSLIMQSSSSSKWLPALMDVGASLGYKLNDKSTVGIKAAYKLGFGQPIKDIHFSSEGLNMGVFGDVKIKGSWWISGGAEYNYLSGFKRLQELHDNVQLWQQSALLGISRKVKIGKRTNNVQILYDFLWKQQIPASGSPLKFRMGFGL
ncbi:hypothetical protein QEG73_00010 [Chitinophagaceae bacterium 26-R-25]|nr:hypothetical protein [Chitinophagaceae bacterium 26-R-25]